MALYTMRTAFEGLLHVWSNRLGFHNLFGKEGLEVGTPPPTRGGMAGQSRQLTHQTHSISMLRWMAALGHKERFPPPRPSASYGFSYGTFAGAHGNGRDAPIDGVSRRLRLSLGC